MRRPVRTLLPIALLAATTTVFFACGGTGATEPDAATRMTPDAATVGPEAGEASRQDADVANDADRPMSADSGALDGPSRPDRGSAGRAVELPPGVATSSALGYCPFDVPGGPPSAHEGRPVLRICPIGMERAGCDFHSLPEGIAAAQAGDRVEIVAGTYEECADIRQDGLHLVGVCGRPHIRDTICRPGRGILVPRGDDTLIENLEISGATPAAGDGNECGIRILGGDLTVQHSYIHDNYNGICGSGISTAHVELYFNYIENNGNFDIRTNDEDDWGREHNVYFSGDQEVVAKYNLFAGARGEGHEFKSRARMNTLECNVLTGLRQAPPERTTDGAHEYDSYTIHIVHGGHAELRFNTLHEVDGGGQRTMIAWSRTTNLDPVQTLMMRKNLIFADRERATFLGYRATEATSMELTGNTLVGFQQLLRLDDASPATYFPDVEDNDIYPTRSEAAARGVVGAETVWTVPEELPVHPACVDWSWEALLR